MLQTTNWSYKLKVSIELKNIDIKITHTTFFDDIINMKKFDPNKSKIDEKSYKNILIYHIECDDQRLKMCKKLIV